MVKSDYHSFRKKSALFQGKVALLPNLMLSPTIESRDASANEDYWQQSCIPSQSMEIISKHFRWSENKRSIAVMCTFYLNTLHTIKKPKRKSQGLELSLFN
jgi:hypothetical protein